MVKRLKRGRVLIPCIPRFFKRHGSASFFLNCMPNGFNSDCVADRIPATWNPRRPRLTSDFGSGCARLGVSAFGFGNVTAAQTQWQCRAPSPPPSLPSLPSLPSVKPLSYFVARKTPSSCEAVIHWLTTRRPFGASNPLTNPGVWRYEKNNRTDSPARNSNLSDSTSIVRVREKWKQAMIRRSWTVPCCASMKNRSSPSARSRPRSNKNVSNQSRVGALS